MEENLNIESGATEEVATPQNEEIVTNEAEPQQTDELNTMEGISEESEEVAAPQPEVEENVQNIQSAEENSRYAKLRRESEQKGMDKAIEALGLSFQGNPIKTYADYEKAKQLEKYYEEAQTQGIDPKFYSDFREMQTELETYKKEKSFMTEDRELSSDPVRGEIYSQCKDEIKEMSEAYGVNLKTAFTLYLESNINTILENAKKTATNKAVENINKNSSSTPGALGNQATQPTENAWDLSDEDFNKMLEKAKNGNLRK